MKALFVLFWLNLFTVAVAFWHVLAVFVQYLTSSNLGLGRPTLSVALVLFCSIVCFIIAKVIDKTETAHSPKGE